MLRPSTLRHLSISVTSLESGIFERVTSPGVMAARKSILLALDFELGMLILALNCLFELTFFLFSIEGERMNVSLLSR